ncbi:HipA domain-containing protein [Microbacterium sp. 18062]|uniref:HipA domain-containing protein n=1 Tax=Microbacterium sp. 18062 TaxID=2681410 RepID=UPI0013588AF0|nr:HipA domain-containing protein [Microbacterium sp. 18062]
MPELLEVSLAGRPIGTLTAGGRSRRTVELSWNDEPDMAGVRLTESFAVIPGLDPDRTRLSRFLGGYLPEGNQRNAMAVARGIASDDLFGFLREYGGSLAGALSFRPAVDTARYDRMTSGMLRRAFAEATSRHNQGARDDSRSMIPGFQAKVLVAGFGDGNWYQPHGSAHSTHILKPPRTNATARLYDEYYGHLLARAVGLASFRSEMRRFDKAPYLAIERYDRRVTGDLVEVVHQEDAAQAIGLDWTSDVAKFQDPHRPRDPSRASAYAIAEVLAGVDGDPLTTWLEHLAFRVLIGDNDGHAKNVSILHLPGEDRVADLYDAVPNLFQEERINWDLALAIDGVFDHRNLTRGHLEREAASWGVRPIRARKVLDDLFERFAEALDGVTFPHAGSPMVPAALRWNLSRLREGAEIGERPR